MCGNQFVILVIDVYSIHAGHTSFLFFFFFSHSESYVQPHDDLKLVSLKNNCNSTGLLINLIMKLPVGNIVNQNALQAMDFHQTNFWNVYIKG